MKVLIFLRKVIFLNYREITALYRRHPLPKGLWGDVIWWGLAATCSSLALAAIWLIGQ